MSLAADAALIPIPDYECEDVPDRGSRKKANKLMGLFELL